jgi:hypothetical protein
MCTFSDHVGFGELSVAKNIGKSNFVATPN